MATVSQLQKDIKNFKALLAKDSTPASQKKAYTAALAKAEAQLLQMDAKSNTKKVSSLISKYKKAPVNSAKKTNAKKAIEPSIDALRKDVEEMKGVMNAKGTSEQVKQTLQKSIDKIEEKIKSATAVKKEEKPMPTAKVKKSIKKAAVKKTALPKKKVAAKKVAPKVEKKAVKKTTGKKETIKSLLKDKKSLFAKYSGSSTDNLERDAKRPARSFGKRVSATGNVYYEYRANRFDVKQGKRRRYPILEKGGTVTNKKEVVIDYLINNESDESLIKLMKVDEFPSLKPLAELWLKNKDKKYEKIYSAIEGQYPNSWFEKKYDELDLYKYSNGGLLGQGNYWDKLQSIKEEWGQDSDVVAELEDIMADYVDIELSTEGKVRFQEVLDNYEIQMDKNVAGLSVGDKVAWKNKGENAHIINTGKIIGFDGIAINVETDGTGTKFYINEWDLCNYPNTHTEFAKGGSIIALGKIGEKVHSVKKKDSENMTYSVYEYDKGGNNEGYVVAWRFTGYPEGFQEKIYKDLEEAKKNANERSYEKGGQTTTIYSSGLSKKDVLDILRDWANSRLTLDNDEEVTKYCKEKSAEYMVPTDVIKDIISYEEGGELENSIYSKAWVRQDLLAEGLSAPVGETSYSSAESLMYKLDDEGLETEQMYVYLDDKWQSTNSIDWQFEEPEMKVEDEPLLFIEEPKEEESVFAENTETREMPSHFGSGENINVFGYQTNNFDICGIATEEFEKAISMIDNDSDDDKYKKLLKEALAKMAENVDAIFSIEKAAFHKGFTDKLEIMLMASKLELVGINNIRSGLKVDTSFLGNHVYEISSKVKTEENIEVDNAINNFDEHAFLDFIYPKVSKTLLDNHGLILNKENWSITDGGTKVYYPSKMFANISGEMNNSGGKVVDEYAISYFDLEKDSDMPIGVIKIDLDSKEVRMNFEDWDVNDSVVYKNGGELQGDEDEIAKRVLEDNGYTAMESTNVVFFEDKPNMLIGTLGSNSEDTAIVFITGGKQNPDNQELGYLIDKKQLREIKDTYHEDEVIHIFTNAGVELRSNELKQKEWKNFKIHKIGEGYTYSNGGQVKKAKELKELDAQFVSLNPLGGASMIDFAVLRYGRAFVKNKKTGDYVEIKGTDEVYDAEDLRAYLWDKNFREEYKDILENGGEVKQKNKFKFSKGERVKIILTEYADGQEGEVEGNVISPSSGKSQLVTYMLNGKLKTTIKDYNETVFPLEHNEYGNGGRTTGYKIVFENTDKGIVVRNQMHELHGEYKMIAEIDAEGKVSYKVVKDNLPEHIQNKIDQEAELVKKYGLETSEYKSGGRTMGYKLLFQDVKNGMDVCNQMDEVHGEYKVIAKINESGDVKYLVSENNLPEHIKNRIQKEADMVAKYGLVNEEYKHGGAIPNSYKGLSSEDVWNSWDASQRLHFLQDHIKYNPDFSQYADDGKLELLDFNGLPMQVRSEVGMHVHQGQYKKGGSLKKSAIEIETPYLPAVIADSVAFDLGDKYYPKSSDSELIVYAKVLATFLEQKAEKEYAKPNSSFKHRIGRGSEIGRDRFFEILTDWGETWIDLNPMDKVLADNMEIAMKDGGLMERGGKFRKVLREFKDGKLNDSHGNKVTDRKQAVAIAFSEADEIKEDGGTVSEPVKEYNPLDGTINISDVVPSKIEVEATSSFGSPDKLIVRYNGKKIAQFYYNMRGYNQDFWLYNKEKEQYGFGKDRPQSRQISDFKKALKEGYIYIKHYKEKGGEIDSTKTKSKAKTTKKTTVKSSLKDKYK